jgi:hypothetical protein
MTESLGINTVNGTNIVPGTNREVFTPRELSVIGKILDKVGFPVSSETNAKMNNILKIMLVYGFLLILLTASLAGGSVAAKMKLRGAYDHKHQVTLLQYLAALTPMILKVTTFLSGFGATGGAVVGAVFGVMEKRATEFFTAPANSMKDRLIRLSAKPDPHNLMAAGHGAVTGAGLAAAAGKTVGAVSNVKYYLERGVGQAITRKMPDFATVLSRVASERAYAEEILVTANAATGRMVSGGLINIMVALYGYALTLCNNIGMRLGEVIIMTLSKRYEMMRDQNVQKDQNDQQLLEAVTRMAIRGTGGGGGGGGTQVMRLGAPGNTNRNNRNARTAAETLMGLSKDDEPQ